MSCILVLQGVFFYSVIQYEPVTYLDYRYPWWGEFIGWLMALSSILVMPGFAVYKLITTPGPLQHVRHAPNII